MKLSLPASSNDRDRVVTFLSLLASEAATKALGDVIDPERLAFELCRIWFDDIYVAGNRYFEGLKGDYSQVAADRFCRNFQPDELAAIERFSRFLELRLDMLPRKAFDEQRIPNNDAWRSLVRDAGYLLEDLEPRAVVRRRRLSDWLAIIEAADSKEVGRPRVRMIKPSED